jgi:hypothetical protein
VIYEVGWLALYANLDLLIGKYGSERTKSVWEQWTHPQWGWKNWAIGALAITIVLLIEGSYRSHRDSENEKEGYKQILHEIENTKPRIVLCYPQSEYVEDVSFQWGEKVIGIAPVVKVRFINKPRTPSPSSIAKGVRAKISFFSEENLLLRIDGRWSRSDQPSIRDPRASKNDLLTVDFGIEEEQDLDIAFREPGGDFIAWNNDNYNYGNFRKPEHRMTADKIDVKILLVAPYVKEEFALSFSKTDSPAGIMLTKHLDFG